MDIDSIRFVVAFFDFLASRSHRVFFCFRTDLEEQKARNAALVAELKTEETRSANLSRELEKRREEMKETISKCQELQETVASVKSIVFNSFKLYLLVLYWDYN